MINEVLGTLHPAEWFQSFGQDYSVLDERRIELWVMSCESMQSTQGKVYLKDWRRWFQVSNFQYALPAERNPHSMVINS